MILFYLNKVGFQDVTTHLLSFDNDPSSHSQDNPDDETRVGEAVGK